MLKRPDIARPRLQAIHDELVAADRLAKWHAELEALKIERDRVADKFRVRYCEVGSELIGIFDQMAAVDAKVHDLIYNGVLKFIYDWTVPLPQPSADSAPTEPPCS